MNYRYELEKGSKKYVCPRCKKRKLVKYISTETNQYLEGDFGRCDAESSCGYFLPPNKTDNQQNTIIIRDGNAYFEFQYDEQLKNKVKKLGCRFDSNTKQWILDLNRFKVDLNDFASNNGFVLIEPKKKHLDVVVPKSILTTTLNGYGENTFILELSKIYGVAKVNDVISKYFLGSVNSALSIPFIANNGSCRAIQVKQFDKEIHTTNTTWIHAIEQYKGDWIKEYNKNEKKVSCLFGEHLLLKYPTLPIGLVEAPKTAIIGTLEQPDILWLALGGKSYLKRDRIEILSGRNVTIYPDFDAYGEWTPKAIEYGFKIDNTILDNGSKEISDLADLILLPKPDPKLETKEIIHLGKYPIQPFGVGFCPW